MVDIGSDELWDPEQNPGMAAAEADWTQRRDPYTGPGDPNGVGSSAHGQGGGIAGYDDKLWTGLTKPSSAEYGGMAGLARLEADRYLGQAQAADNRQGAQIANGELYGQFGMDRQNQLRANSWYQQMIEGRGPSVAEQQQQLGLAQARQQNANALQNAQAAAASRAASARGGGAGLAAAQMQAGQIQGGLAAQAAQQQAQMQQQTVFQAGANRAAEQQAAMQGYAGLTTNMANQTGTMATQQAQLQQQQNALNDARNAAYEQMRQKTYEDQQQARQFGETTNQNAFLGKYQAGNQRFAAKSQSGFGFGGIFD